MNKLYVTIDTEADADKHWEKPEPLVRPERVQYLVGGNPTW